MIDGLDELMPAFRRFHWRLAVVAFCVGLVVGWVTYTITGG